MKIIQVTNSYKPAWQTGGVCRVSFDISTELQKRAHDVSVLTTNWGSESKVPVNQWVDVDGVKVIYYKNWAPTNIVGKMAFPTRPLYKGMDTILQADIVHLHEYRSALSIMVSRLCKKHDIPYIIQMHGAFSQAIGKSNQKKIYDHVFGNEMIANASGIIALTRTEANQLMETGIPGEKIRIIPNGIDPSAFEPLPLAGNFKSKYSINYGQMVLYLGRLDKTKGVDLLIDAFASQFKGCNDTCLVLVGPDDGDQQRLEKLAIDFGLEEQIRFIGYVDASTKLSAIVDADLVVCPSYNGFPIVFLEACACGKPIVTTTKGDEIDILDGLVGLRADYINAALGNCMRSLLEDKNQCKKMGEYGKHITKEKFSMPRIGNQILELYNDVYSR